MDYLALHQVRYLNTKFHDFCLRLLKKHKNFQETELQHHAHIRLSSVEKQAPPNCMVNAHITVDSVGNGGWNIALCTPTCKYPPWWDSDDCHSNKARLWISFQLQQHVRKTVFDWLTVQAKEGRAHHCNVWLGRWLWKEWVTMWSYHWYVYFNAAHCYSSKLA